MIQIVLKQGEHSLCTGNDGEPVANPWRKNCQLHASNVKHDVILQTSEKPRTLVLTTVIADLISQGKWSQNSLSVSGVRPLLELRPNSSLITPGKGGREGRKEGRGEGGREGGKKGRKEGRGEGGREGGKEGRDGGGRKGGREGRKGWGREEGREGGKEGMEEGGREGG